MPDLILWEVAVGDQSKSWGTTTFSVVAPSEIMAREIAMQDAKYAGQRGRVAWCRKTPLLWTGTR